MFVPYKLCFSKMPRNSDVKLSVPRGSSSVIPGKSRDDFVLPKLAPCGLRVHSEHLTIV